MPIQKINDATTIGWVTKQVLIEQYGFPATFIRAFVRKYGETDTRKLVDTKQAARYFRIAKINEIIESGEVMADEPSAAENDTKNAEEKGE